MQAYKCPQCGGDLAYDPKTGLLSCAFCGTKLTRAEYRKKYGAHRYYQTTELVCPQCGAAMLSYDDTIASFCSYCGSSVSFTKRIVEDVKPDGVMPFTLSREEALERFRSTVRQARFAPDWLREESENKLVGIYMPYYSYSGTAAEHLSTEGKCDSTSRPGVKYVYDLELDVEERFSGVRFDAAEVFPDFLSETIDTFEDDPSAERPAEDDSDEDAAAAKKQPPRGLERFDTACLAGFYADGGSVPEETYADILEDLVAEDFRRLELEKDGIRIDNNADAPLVTAEAKKYLYPVWLNTCRYGDRVCYSVINGQDGTVAAEIPVDKNKYLKASVILTAILYFLLNRIWTVKPAAFLCISAGLLLLMGIRMHVFSRNVYLRQAHLDDVGLMGPKRMLERAEIRGKPNIRWFPFLVAFLTFFILLSANYYKAGGGPAAAERNLIPSLVLAVLAGCFGAVVAIAYEERNVSAWRYRVPGSVDWKAWWRPLLGILLSAGILLTRTVHDEPYYLAGIVNVAMAIWTAGDLIEARNLLNSRPIPLFSRKRGGEPDA